MKNKNDIHAGRTCCCMERKKRLESHSTDVQQECSKFSVDIFHTQKNWKETDIERAHRLGHTSSSSDRPRPVIIKFQRWTDAMIVMRDREGKNLMRNNDGLRVGADLTKQQRDTLSQLRGQAKHAYYIKGKLIVQESRPYPHRYNSSSTRGQTPLNMTSLAPTMYPSPTGAGE